ncbi:cysteine desulfurase [Olsenella profusa DSM 13989]|uniref:cysteine desulfurase family protein n=1 Tax=Olsenella profusa TaxID=138595 RepID=UPI0027804D6F|nr:aminotransferase class V-fold PLP-dependent enzyme [Olsenella profusa]MDP9860355.1 cysteine desulfurase [Olsenella profusa DSM 13989]
MGGTRFTYLDYAASAPMRAAALEAERAYEASEIAGANPNSLHTLGRRAARALDGARTDIARCLGGGFRPADIVFTSGGTESNNIALHGMAEALRLRERGRRRILVLSIEHDSEVDVVPSLRERGFEVGFVPVGRDGKARLDWLGEHLDDSCALVSLMSANNETGVVQPVGQAARMAHGVGALVHTDAAQAFGRIPLDLADVDAVSLAAHKIGGPVGIGALALRGRRPFRPQAFGGGQEQGRRPGTQDVRAALAFAAAARYCTEHLEEFRALVSGRARALHQRLAEADCGIEPTTDGAMGDDRLPGIVSVMTRRIDSETLVLKLDQAGFEVSAASACSSTSLDASHVLLAMGIPRDVALGSLRVSFDERVSEDDLVRFADALVDVVRSAR